MTSGITLLIFTTVNLGLWRRHRRQPRSTGFAAPALALPLAAALYVGLVAAQLLLQ